MRITILLAFSLAAIACDGQPTRSAGDADAAAGAAAAPSSASNDAGAGADSAFAALQERGRVAMGVDQYTSTHVFDSLEDGGRIELQRNEDDPESTEAIRRHLQHIAEAFSRGDFRIPGFVHAQEVPGTRVMAERREHITYTFRELPRGGEVRITTQDPAALAAIHEFLAFQRMDHRAGGKEPGEHGPGGHAH